MIQRIKDLTGIMIKGEFNIMERNVLRPHKHTLGSSRVCDRTPLTDAFALSVLIRAIKVTSVRGLITHTVKQGSFMPTFLSCHRFLKSLNRRMDHSYAVWCYRRFVSYEMFLGVLLWSFLQLSSLFTTMDWCRICMTADVRLILLSAPFLSDSWTKTRDSLPLLGEGIPLSF